MAGNVAIKACRCTPVVLNPRVSTRASDKFKCKSSLSFPLHTAAPCLKSKGFFLHVSSMSSQPEKKMNKINSLLPNIQQLSDLKRGPRLARASKDKPFFLPFPIVEEKPKWWWRTLACLPYLLNFYDQQYWTYAHPTTNPPLFLENFDALLFPLLSAIFTLPKFFISAYAFFSFFGIVRRKEWPHFFRFHLINAILIGTLIQVTGVASGWFPEWFFPKHFWCIATFMFLVTVLECIRCALAGVYPEIPFVRDAAHLYSDLNQK